MAEYEQTKSEGGLYAGGSSPKKTANYVEAVALRNELDAIAKENKQKKEEEYGRDLEAYSKGRNARLAGYPLDSSKYSSDDSKRSYYKGYVYGGNKQLKMTAENRMTELATLAYYGFGDKDYDAKKYGFPTRKEFASSRTPEYLYVIGYCDATNGIINFNELPEEIRVNVNYVQGFNDAKVLIDGSKKKR